MNSGQRSWARVAAAASVAVGALVLLWLMPQLAQAGTVNVPAGGSIQNAIDAANPGDTIRVEQGLFTETLVITKSLGLSGGYNSAFTSRIPRTTIIDGNGSGPCIEVSGSGIKVTVDGFEIKNGST